MKNDVETDLYRHFDASGELLYVGISLSAIGRLAQHKRRASWASQIANVTIETFPTRKEALRAEAQAIVTENPKYNLQRPSIQAGGFVFPKCFPDSYVDAAGFPVLAVRLTDAEGDGVLVLFDQYDGFEIVCGDLSYVFFSEGNLMQINSLTDKARDWYSDNADKIPEE